MGESMEDANLVLKCWAPTDRFVARIGHSNGRPLFRYDTRVKARYPPGDRSLRFGESTSYRCALVRAAFAGGCGSGVRIVMCMSRSSGLTCFNTTDRRGFWLGRYRGYRAIRV